MLAFQSANLVLAGNFNPYILSPEWLTNQNIWTPKELRVAVGAVSQDGIQLNGDGITWIISSSRLSISSSETDQCQRLSKSLLEKLPHTPIGAVGITFTFHNSHRTNDPICDVISGRLAGHEESTVLFKWGAVLHQDNAQSTSEVVEGSNGVTSTVHFHRNSNELAETNASLDRIPADFEVAIGLANTLLMRGED